MNTEIESKMESQVIVDPSQLTTNSMDIMENQPTINIGMIGNATHGKSTVIHKMTGVNPLKHEIEKTRNLTIKLGYANTKVYQCPTCPKPSCFKSMPSSTKGSPSHDVPGCTEKMTLIKHISFVDCPGHDLLMATMLAGASVMDAAFLLISGNEACPQPQTAEHLAAVEIMDLKSVIVLQSKMDLVTPDEAKNHHKQIQSFVQGTCAQDSPILPISAVMSFNLDVVCQYICSHIPTPIRDFTSPPLLSIVRSFDVNLPGSSIEKLVGGVAGGSLIKGILKLGDQIEIRPGLVEKDTNGVIRCSTLTSQVQSLFSDKNQLQFAAPGGLIGVGTNIDPILCKGDRLVGKVLGLVGTLPEVYIELEFAYYLVRKLLGVRSTAQIDTKVAELACGEVLMLTVGSTSCGGKIIAVKSKRNSEVKSKERRAKICLLQPICCQIGEKIAISRRINKNWRLIGWAEVKRGTTSVLEKSS